MIHANDTFLSVNIKILYSNYPYDKVRRIISSVLKCIREFVKPGIFAGRNKHKEQLCVPWT